MGTAAGKYVGIAAAAFALVVLMKFVGIQEFWYGMKVATLIVVLAWIIMLIPDSSKGIKTALMILIAVIAFLAFALPPIVKMVVPLSVQRAWETGSITQRLGLTNRLYDPTARGREGHEEMCRDENENLSDAGNGEIGKTLNAIEQLKRENPGLDILGTTPPSLADLTLEELKKRKKELGSIKTIEDFDKMTLDGAREITGNEKSAAADKYRALQRIVRIQRENAVAEYYRCMGKAPKAAAKEKTAPENNSPAPGSSHTHGLKDLNVKDDVAKLKTQLPDAMREFSDNPVTAGYIIAGMLFILGLLFAMTKVHTAADFLFWSSVVVAILTTVLWVARHAQ